MKIGRNESCPCGSGKKYKKCCLGKEMEKTSLTGESLPIYKCWISNPEGSRIAVISRIKPNGNFEIASMLIDEWKMGLKDGFGHYNLTKDKLDEYISQRDFREATIEECKKLIKRGIFISKSLGFRLPKEYERYNGIIGNIDSIAINGSLYKCYTCEENDLSEETVSKIKEVTLKDVTNGVCGTPNETMIYFTCDQCKEKKKTNVNIEEHEHETPEEDDFWAESSFIESASPEEIRKRFQEFQKARDSNKLKYIKSKKTFAGEFFNPPLTEIIQRYARKT